MELLGENPGHFPGDTADNGLQLSLGLLHVVPLVRQVGIPGIHPFVLFYGADVGRAQGGDALFQLPDPPGGFGNALQLYSLGLGVAMAQLVVLPETVNDLFFLHAGGS